jgi:gas vesicle protein
MEQMAITGCLKRTVKNPFEKNDHKALVAGIIIGSVAAGAAAYLFLTVTGTSVRKELAGHFSRMRDAFIGGEPEPSEDHAKDYLQHKGKKPKTDRLAVLKHEIIGGQQEEHHGEQQA